MRDLTFLVALLDAVTGGASHEQRMYDDFEDEDARHARCAESVVVVRALRRGGTVRVSSPAAGAAS